MLPSATRATIAALAALTLYCAACRPGTTAPSGNVKLADASDVSASAIAGGTSLWVETDPGHPYMNAKVDVGTLRAVGDEIEATLEWPVLPGQQADGKHADPPLHVPAGSALFEHVRLTCAPHGVGHGHWRNRLIAPDGRQLRREEKDPATVRRDIAERVGPYHDGPYALVCWAAARKCEGKALLWPPPPYDAPRELSERATRMNAANDALYVPGCKLGS